MTITAPAEVPPVGTATPPPPVPHTPWGRAVALALGAGVVVVAILLAFLWPTITSSVKDLPVAVAGP
ncbi:MAG: hypothetical protein JF618_06920 [Leifsonia sp.]|nr:hypothetical protein [Leifsonia sp.]